MNTTFLTYEEVRRVLKLEPVIRCVEEVYTAKALGETVVWPTVFYEFDPGHRDMDIRSGYLKKMGIFGHKTVSFMEGNAEKGIPTLVGTIVLLDDHTGLPLGFVDGSLITCMRTGAAGATGAKYLARKNSQHLFILGAGNQAPYQIAATLINFPQLKKVTIADVVRPENAVRFAAGIRPRLLEEFGIDASGVTFAASEDIAADVHDSDIIITVTPSKSPVIRKEWVSPGTHFSCIGADMEGKEEIDPELFAGARIFVDDIPHCCEAGETEIPLKKGIIDRSAIVGEIGELILGQKPGRTSDEEITIYDACGMAILDLAAAKIALDLAEKQ